MVESDENRVRTTEKSLRILECLQQQEEAGVTAIANELDMSKGTVHSHLATLVACGYATHHGQTYTVSTKLLRMGRQIRDRSPLYKTTRPEMTKLAEATDGVVRLYLKDGEFATLIAHEGHHPDIRRQPLGSQTALTDSIAGTVMLAEHGRDSGSNRETAAGEEVTDDVYDQFDHIQQQGYAVGSDAGSEASRTFAVALSKRDNSVLGTLSVTVVGEDLDDRQSPGEQLLRAAERAELSFTSWYDSRETFSPKHAAYSPSE